MPQWVKQKKISKYFLEKNINSKIHCTSAIRDLFTFLFTHFGILRGESLFRAELSDFMMLTFPNEGKYPVDCLVTRITTGKTNSKKTIYGRVMRHSDPGLCSIGGLAMYLLARFKFWNEELDFTENEKWFDVKLLSSNSNLPEEKKSYNER